MSAVSIAPLIIVNRVRKPRLGPVLIPQIGDGHLSPGQGRLVDRGGSVFLELGKTNLFLSFFFFSFLRGSGRGENGDFSESIYFGS